MGYELSEQMRAWAKANNFDPDIHIEYFQDYIANKPGKPYKDLDAAFRNCIRADWAQLRRNSQKGQINGKGYESERDKARRIAVRELTGYDPDAIKGVSARID